MGSCVHTVYERGLILSFSCQCTIKNNHDATHFNEKKIRLTLLLTVLYITSRYSDMYNWPFTFRSPVLLSQIFP